MARDETAKPLGEDPTRAYSIDPLRHIIGFHVAQANLRIQRHFMDSMMHLDLTPKQVAVLWLVEEYPDIAQIELAQLLQIDRNTIMGIVNRLEKRGFLSRAQGDGDKRRQVLVISDEGLEALRRAREAVEGHERWLKRQFSPREQAQLMALLERIYSQL